MAPVFSSVFRCGRYYRGCAKTETERERETHSTARECVGIPVFDKEEGSGSRNRIQELELQKEPGGIRGRGTWTTPREFKVTSGVLAQLITERHSYWPR